MVQRVGGRGQGGRRKEKEGWERRKGGGRKGVKEKLGEPMGVMEKGRE